MSAFNFDCSDKLSLRNQALFLSALLFIVKVTRRSTKNELIISSYDMCNTIQLLHSLSAMHTSVLSFSEKQLQHHSGLYRTI